MKKWGLLLILCGGLLWLRETPCSIDSECTDKYLCHGGKCEEWYLQRTAINNCHIACFNHVSWYYKKYYMYDVQLLDTRDSVKGHCAIEIKPTTHAIMEKKLDYDNPVMRKDNGKKFVCKIPEPTPVTPEPTPKSVDPCYNEIDWGLKKDIPDSGVLELNVPHALSTTMKYEIYNSVSLDPRGLKSYSPLSSVKEDGGAHDPRYPFDKKRISKIDDTTDCFGETFLFSRKDDHNPFFMISLILNAWMISGKTDVIVLMYDDAGYQPVDGLFKVLFSPSREIMYAHQHLFYTWCFTKLWVQPTEYTGALMTHLNDNQPCRKSSMITSFVNDIYSLYPEEKTKTFIPQEKTNPIITFVGRRNYNERHISRILKNEKEIVSVTKDIMTNYNVRLIYYEDLSIDEQIYIYRTTDIMIGMHGAGLVHSLFLPQGSTLIEIFPRYKRRWGYRNIAYYRDLKYYQFRGGVDGTLDSKFIDKTEWARFLQTVNHDAG